MISEQTNPATPRDFRIGACCYLLHCLLQRLDQQQPGLLSGMIEGITNDRNNMKAPNELALAEAVETANTALSMLRLMDEQLKSIKY